MHATRSFFILCTNLCVFCFSLGVRLLCVVRVHCDLQMSTSVSAPAPAPAPAPRVNGSITTVGASTSTVRIHTRTPTIIDAGSKQAPDIQATMRINNSNNHSKKQQSTLTQSTQSSTQSTTGCNILTEEQ